MVLTTYPQTSSSSSSPRRAAKATSNELEYLRKAAVESSQKRMDEAVELMTVLEAEAANAWSEN
jgi:hypothetical protein